MRIKALAISLFISCQSLSQNVSLSELISIINKSNWESANTLLMNKGWVYYNSEKESLNQYGTISWSYNKSYYDDKAKGWISLYTLWDIPHKVSYQFHTKSIYTNFQNSIISNGFKKEDSEINDNLITLNYSKKGYLLSLATGKSDQDFASSTIYTITLSKYTTVDPKPDLYKSKNGLIKDYDDDGNLTCECNYKNDILNGAYKLYEGNQLTESGTYINGKKNGKYKAYKNGKIDIEGTYKNDLFEGLQTYYYYDESGKLSTKSMGNISGFNKQGLWKDIVYINGKEIVYQYQTYINDKLSGPFKIVDNNEIIIGVYKDEILDGPYKLYVDYLTKEGDLVIGDLTKAYLKEEGFYKDGVQTGKWRYYNEDKTLIEEVLYVDGERQ